MVRPRQPLGPARCTRELNHIYLDTPAFWNNDLGWAGFTWCDPNDAERSMLTFLRWDTQGRGYLVVCNFCPVLREDVRVGLPMACRLNPILNTDEARFGGSGVELKNLRSEPVSENGFDHSVSLVSPPMSPEPGRSRHPRHCPER